MLVRSYITGIRPAAFDQFVDADQGQVLRLVRNRHRRFDPFSIEVLSAHDELVGFLPGTHSRILAPIMEHGLALQARLVTARRWPRPAVQVDVEIAGRGSEPELTAAALCRIESEWKCRPPSIFGRKSLS
ncbi:MAG: HIRAN domain-containing protein [Mesorhizobium sp.]|nr:HIRAN domain-containing protein [Mesorhizobium sp.]